MGSRIQLFWRSQIAGWIAPAIFTSPLKRVILENIPGSIAISLYRDAVGFLQTIGMREIYCRVHGENASKLQLAELVILIPLVCELAVSIFILAS